MSEDDFHKKTTLTGVSKETPTTSNGIVEIPKMIGPYKIESLLEKGGMSILYLALHPETKEPTTIKVLLPRFLSHPDVVERFLNEAEIISMTDHPNIVKLYGHGEWEGGLYIAMEFIQGISLRQALLQSPISLKRALDIVIDIAYALCHLHTHGVIHRDLKPENILITESGQVKVIDFGIAQLLTEKSATDVPAKQRLIGTPIYMSPEQRENPENVSYPSDIYSLGIITYELILGKLSHGQVHLSLMPKGIQKILNRALQPRAQDRYQDIVDFITDISAYLNSTNWQKERMVGDQLSELLENFRAAKEVLAPSELPHWSGIELGLTSYRGLNIAGVYYDFFDFPDGDYGIMMGESSAKGAEGIIYTAMLRGMIQALRGTKSEPEKLAEALNRLVFEDHLDKIFTLSCLRLSPKKNQLSYLSCGYGSLWKIVQSANQPARIQSNNLALGIEKEVPFVATTSSWDPHDCLIMSSFAAATSEKPPKHEFSEEFLKQVLAESTNLSPQKIVDTVLLKAKLSLSKYLQERTLTLISVSRL